MFKLTSPSPEPVCYFSLAPSTPSDHFSDETPLLTPYLSCQSVHSDPRNPLLALRSPPLTPNSTMEAANFMSLQTAAAYQYSQPKARSSEDRRQPSIDSTSSSDFTPHDTGSHVCSRCHRQGCRGFVCYSVNSYYCQHCAAVVGYGPR